MSEGRYSTIRPEGREHFPKTPKGFIAIRIVQLILAVAVLGLDAYVLSNVLFDGAELTIFVSLATMIACIYHLVVDFGKDAWKGYNYWAILSLDIFLLIFWLIAFALDAARVAPFANGWTICDAFECIYYPLDYYLELFACMCTMTGLGGVEFALFIISLAVHSVAMHRHRAAGLHCKAVSSFDRENNTNNNNNSSSSAAAAAAANNNSDNNAPIPLTEKHDHAAPSYVSAVPPPSEQQHSHQSLYAVSQPSVTPHTATSPYQPPAAVAPMTQQVTGGSSSGGGGGGGGGHAGYYEAAAHQQQQQQQQGGASYQQHHSSSFGGPIPAPHPGSYEAPGSPVGYA